MVRIETNKENNKYTKITFKDHANYDKFGKDIVCAAVSSTMLCTVNAIYLFDDDSIDIVKDNNLFIIKVVKENDITNKLLENMMRCLKSIEEQYPKNIKIK